MWPVVRHSTTQVENGVRQETPKKDDKKARMNKRRLNLLVMWKRALDSALLHTTSKFIRLLGTWGEEGRGGGTPSTRDNQEDVAWEQHKGNQKAVPVYKMWRGRHHKEVRKEKWEGKVLLRLREGGLQSQWLLLHRFSLKNERPAQVGSPQERRMRGAGLVQMAGFDRPCAKAARTTGCF
jgi:hypothetical protein